MRRVLPRLMRHDGTTIQAQPWPDDAQGLAIDKVIELYEGGFAGGFLDLDAQEMLDELLKNRFGSYAEGDSLVHGERYADSGKGQLTLLFPAVTNYYGHEALTFPGQETGDCVSMGGRDASLFLCCIDAASNTPDEASGKVEQPPTVSEVARRNGVFANEGIYLNRGHNGQGMSCDQGLNWVMTKGGVVVRADYSSNGGINLEKYNVGFEVKGSRGSPEWLNSIGKTHQIRSASRLKGHEAIRDGMFATKCPVWNCSSLGFARTRDDNGFAKRSGGWSHSWHTIGYDDRPWTYERYGFPLALSGHRWGKWNSGGRRVYGTNLDIPEGYWWHDARLLDQNWTVLVNSLSGWAKAKRELPPIQMVVG
jgi:hypothetical protein